MHVSTGPLLWLFVLTQTSLAIGPTAHSAIGKKKVLTVGYLTAIKGELKDRQGLAVSGAVTMALNEINSNPHILPNVTLALRWNDTRGDTVQATRALTEMLCDGVSALFGPEGPCHVEAIVAQARNVPMISYKCSDYKASLVPTFARTEPPDTQVTKSVISLLRYYNWHKFSVIHEHSWENVALSLEEQAKTSNLTVNHMIAVQDPHICCEKNLPCCQSGYWYQVIQDTKDRTRIYVFLGTSKALVDMMNTMESAQLFENGEYMVIFVDMMTYSPREAKNYLWRSEQLLKKESCYQEPGFEKRAKSLLVVVSTPPTKNYESFTEKVREFNAKDPFNFSTPTLFEQKNYIQFVSIYAAYLYDSVKLYARALNDLLNRHPVVTDEIIDEVASNGTEIIQTIVNYGTYISVTGATIRLDKNGDSEGNFSVLALKPFNLTLRDGGTNFTCDHYMIPVGYFLSTQTGGASDSYPAYQIIRRLLVDWPNGVRPEDEPSCGFLNEQCPKDDSHVNSLVAAGALAVTLFCTSVIIMSIYRKWKIEQEIEGLLWMIDIHEIHGYFGNDIVSSPSKLSLASAASFGSRCSNQLFTATAKFRGLVVRVKELKFSKKKDISRDIMKEMRLLRELRHDNVNSFIGACVEPMRVLLVTDYCAKGSLYDIIENEDIKLDEMFIASLIHDLIKGMLYIHASPLICHGNLKSSNCVVTSRWMLQVADFGLHELRHCAESDSIGEHQYYHNLFWKAPELLRSPMQNIRGTQKGDVYSFAIILYEILGRRGPFGCTSPREPKDIIELVKNPVTQLRPDVSLLREGDCCADYILAVMQDCWNEIPDQRPDFTAVRARLKKMRGGKSRNIMDQMMEMMEKYANNLEDIVSERTRLLCEEKRKTEDLLHRMLPEPVAERLTKGHGVEPVSFDSVTIYFSDIVGFTAMSAESTPLQVVNFLNDLYTVFDRIIKGYDVYKVETIGDAYMVVSGLPIKNDDRHVGEIASMSLDLLAAVRTHQISHRPNETLKLRIGVHTGPVVAGVVGLTMPRYCLFGDTVNTASRMESNGEPLKIHVSPQCKAALDKLGGYVTEERGLVPMKGKGHMLTYWLVGATEKAIQKRDVDLGELPPLFCRPRRSPKLASDSRRPSLVGSGSRRQSIVPRGSSISLSVTNTSTVSNRRVDRAPLYLTGGGGGICVQPTNTNTSNNGTEQHSRSSIPRTTEEVPWEKEHSSRRTTRRIRESRSLDPFPVLGTRRRSSCPASACIDRPCVSRSLENCRLTAINGNRNSSRRGSNGGRCQNGSAVVLQSQDDQDQDPARPLLSPSARVEIAWAAKRWRSLEAVLPAAAVAAGNHDGRKPPTRASLRSWLLGLFGGNGFRNSDLSLRKAVLTGYTDMQPEKESIV